MISSTPTGQRNDPDFDRPGSDRPGFDGLSMDGPDFDGRSFDDDVLTSAQRHARILREFGYRTEASHIERFVDRRGLVEEAPAA